MNILDFEMNYNFYQKYHTNSVNRLIHIFCIPLIIWTASVMLVNVNVTKTLNLSKCLLTFYSLYYLMFSFKLGIIMTFLLYLVYKNSVKYKGLKVPFMMAFLLHLVAWVLQILGHSLFENNRPAFMDNLVQSFLMAPIFVLNEVLTFF